MNTEIKTPSAFDEARLIAVARDVALQLKPLADILNDHSVTTEQFATLKSHPRFQQVLQAEIASWETATNTHERVKMKAAVVIEDWLPEAYAQLHNAKEPLSARAQLGKLVASIAGMGLSHVGVEGDTGNRLSVTINLGDDNKLTFEKSIPPKVIEATPVPSE